MASFLPGWTWWARTDGRWWRHCPRWRETLSWPSLVWRSRWLPLLRGPWRTGRPSQQPCFRKSSWRPPPSTTPRKPSEGPCCSETATWNCSCGLSSLMFHFTVVHSELFLAFIVVSHKFVRLQLCSYNQRFTNCVLLFCNRKKQLHLLGFFPLSQTINSDSNPTQETPRSVIGLSTLQNTITVTLLTKHSNIPLVGYCFDLCEYRVTTHTHT